MTNYARLKNKALAWVFSRFPSLGAKAADKIEAVTFDTIPWTALKKPLSESRLSLVTTAGVHLRSDEPFNMADPTGDPTVRVIPSDVSATELMITHDYYDHTGADEDINIVFPLERLRELRDRGRIGSLAARYYGFMGHIEPNHIPALMETYAPRVAAMMKEDGVDVALLTPG